MHTGEEPPLEPSQGKPEQKDRSRSRSPPRSPTPPPELPAVINQGQGEDVASSSSGSSSEGGAEVEGAGNGVKSKKKKNIRQRVHIPEEVEERLVVWLEENPTSTRRTTNTGRISWGSGWPSQPRPWS